jgi:uncharacterized membrane protein YkvA (DUF1232 family)
MLDRLKSMRHRFRRELKVYRLVLRDPRTPRMAKLLLALAVAYAALPFDLIPDFIPVIGHVDDVIIVPVLVIMALKVIPQEVVDEHRRSVSL